MLATPWRLLSVDAPCARTGAAHIREASPTGSRPVEAPTVRVRGSSRRPDRRGLEPAAGTCHDARVRARRGRLDSYQKTDGPAAWFGVRRCTEAKESPGRAGALRHQGRCLVLLTRRPDTIPRHKSGKARLWPLCW